MRRFFALALLLLCVSRPLFAQSQAPLVDLEASDPSAGTPVWRNLGSLGPFRAIGQPSLVRQNGIPAVAFDGFHDAYEGPLTVPALEGSAPRTIEVWAFNPTLDSPEETMVSWGRRGGPGASMLAFGWGTDGGYGAAAHWSDDMGWNGTPLPAKWHYLVYTYDGHTADIYDDVILKNHLDTTLQTMPGTTLLVAAQHSPAGNIAFLNEYTQGQLGGSLDIASLKISSGALSLKQIEANFEAQAAHYGAKKEDAEGYLADGTTTFHTSAFSLTLLNATGTAAMLTPANSGFDFLPGDRITSRSGPGYYYLGDITLKVRRQGGAWHYYSSAARRAPAAPVLIPGALQADDITPSLAEGCPLDIKREWLLQEGRLTLRFLITNSSGQAQELGAFGAAMVFNNLITGRSLNETHDTCSFATPYPGGNAGYLQVTRLNGHGPALLVIPEKGTSFEAYRPLYDDPTPRGVTFEGFYEWMTNTEAYAENEWKNAPHWNPPTSRLIQPGQTISYGYRFALSPSIQKIEATLIHNRRPVAIGIPGYVLPMGEDGHLYLNTPWPVKSVVSDPPGALTIASSSWRSSNGYRAYKLHGEIRGRCRLTIRYTNGQVQYIQYYVTPPEPLQVERYGSFMSSKQWFTDPSDPFHRTDSFLAYDKDTAAMVLQHSHTWFAGLSDEIGAGPSVGMAMKNFGQLDPTEVQQLDLYASQCLWGHVQNRDYSVRASLFYYDPKALPNYDYTVNEGWDKARSETTWRTFNYPHVTCVYWALYRIARYHPELKMLHPWSWYLNQAYETIMAIPKFASGYTGEGLMVGSVFPRVILDMRREGWKKRADTVQRYMHTRERVWENLKYPFGSEMPWDSTGQEEIYTWCRYFHDAEKANVTISAIRGYMPTVPNWAYNGAGRRYFDGPVNGCKYQQIVQITNHYGSGINAIPLLDDYRRHPTDSSLLRIGYAGLDQLMCNIDPQGFASYAFITDPAVLAFDPYTADYGIAFYGYARNTGAYIMKSPNLGWLNFGCNVLVQGSKITVTPCDGFHKRLFIAPFGLWIRLDAGRIQKVTFDRHTRRVWIKFAPASSSTHTAYVRASVTNAAPGHAHWWHPVQKHKTVRGTWAVPLKSGQPSVLELK